MANKQKIAKERWICRNGVMRLRIKRVVNGMTVYCSQTLIVLNHGSAAAIGKDEIVLWNEIVKSICRICLYTGQRGRRIHIPESHARIHRAALKHFFFQQLVKHANAAVLDDQITLRGLPEQSGQFVSVLINNAAHIRKIACITVLLTAIGVRLGECNVMPQSTQLLVNTAVIGGRAIPVGRCDAGAKGKYLHAAISWQIEISSCARCAQVWRL